MTERRRLAAGLALFALPAAALAQIGDLAGDWDGALRIPAGMELPLILHLADPASTLESPEQSRQAVPIAVTRNGTAVTFTVSGDHGTFTGTLSADGKALDGTMGQHGMNAPAHFARRAAGAPPPVADRPQAPKPPFPYMSEDVHIPSVDGATLAGTLIRPMGVANPPAVVLIAGSGPQNRDETVAGHRPFLLLADRLARAGIAVLRYDKRGVGGSTGSFASATGTEFIADAGAALGWLGAQPGIDRAHIGLIGHSEGAEIAPVVAKDPQAAFVVLLAPPGLKGGEVLVSQKRAIEVAMGLPPAAIEQSLVIEREMIAVATSGADPATIRAKVTELLKARGAPEAQAVRLGDEAASPAFRVLLEDDPIPPLKALKQPVLIVQGGRDLQVVPADNLPPIRAALAGNSKAKIVELPGLNHLLQPATTGAPSEYRAIPITIDEGALKLIVDWVKEQTR